MAGFAVADVAAAELSGAGFPRTDSSGANSPGAEFCGTDCSGTGFSGTDSSTAGTAFAVSGFQPLCNATIPAVRLRQATS